MDKEFISALKNGDSRAYEKLVLTYSKRIYYLCLKMLGNSSDAEDAVQITFLKVYKGINKFEKRSELTTWIYKIAVNTCNDILRKRKNEYILSNLTANDEQTEDFYYKVADEKENIEEKILRKERNKIIYDCIGRLSEVHRKFIVLRDLEGLSYQQISNILNMNIGTVKSGINRARGKLTALIREYENRGL